jgi:hypothetical protein
MCFISFTLRYALTSSAPGPTAAVASRKTVSRHAKLLCPPNYVNRLPYIDEEDLHTHLIDSYSRTKTMMLTHDVAHELSVKR